MSTSVIVLTWISIVVVANQAQSYADDDEYIPSALEAKNAISWSTMTVRILGPQGQPLARPRPSSRGRCVQETVTGLGLKKSSGRLNKRRPMPMVAPRSSIRRLISGRCTNQIRWSVFRSLCDIASFVQSMRM